MVLPASHKVSRVSWYSGAELFIITFTYRTITSYGPTFQLCSVSYNFTLCSVRNPRDKSLVWALSFSLAATGGISVDFFSSGYLDVSVPPGVSSMSRAGHVVSCLNMGGPSSKAKYYLMTDSEAVP